jgi:hypothetical protein
MRRIIVLIMLCFLACACNRTPTITPTTTPSVTSTPMPTATVTPSNMPTSSSTPTASSTPTPTVTNTAIKLSTVALTTCIGTTACVSPVTATVLFMGDNGVGYEIQTSQFGGFYATLPPAKYALYVTSLANNILPWYDNPKTFDATNSVSLTLYFRYAQEPTLTPTATKTPVAHVCVDVQANCVPTKDPCSMGRVEDPAGRCGENLQDVRPTCVTNNHAYIGATHTKTAG